MGRLIDADEVKKRFPIMENDFGMVINERLHKELDKIPTVEAVPLIHAKWMFEEADTDGIGNNRYKCSHCGHGDIHADDVVVDYCWYCGAKMDLSEVEE